VIDGIINVYKERGYTSHDVVAKLRGIMKQKKIGHTGTLDPEAEGVLPVCLGKATKVCELLADQTKEYRAVLRLGVVTDTQDMTGSILEEHPVSTSEEQVRTTILSFLGEQQQIPPMYSALKVNGKKLYELARAGIEVERKARTIRIDAITIHEIRLPEVEFSITCTKGTYVRTLCHDIGAALGCGGCMQSLLRTRVGVFRLEEAYRLDKIEEMVRSGSQELFLVRTDALFGHLPEIRLNAAAQRLVDNGNPISPGVLDQACRPHAPEDGAQYRIYGTDGTFLAIYAWHEDRGSYRAEKMF
jgi:tRNA pseudouridine55 synthase